MAKKVVEDTNITNVAEAIRTKGGTSEKLEFPQGFIDAINAISTGGGGTGNCEAHVTSATNPNVNFTILTSGPIKAWGGGTVGGGWTVKTYAFIGDKYLQGGNPTNMNLKIDKNGKVTGLPRVDSGTVIITRGI